jgi:hypothetical protein
MPPFSFLQHNVLALHHGHKCAAAPAFVPQYKNLLRNKESRIHPARKIPPRIRSRRNPTAAIRIRHYRVLESEWRCPGNLKRRKFSMDGLTPAARIAVYQAVGASGITSVAKIHAAEKTGDAVEAVERFSYSSAPTRP